MKKAIVINCFNRPNYAWISAKFLSMCKGIEDWDVFFVVDGGGCNHDDCSLLLKSSVRYSYRSMGPRDYWPSNMDRAFQDGYECVLSLECDVAVRSDTLLYLSHLVGCGKICSLYHVPSGERELVGFVSSVGTMWDKKIFTKFFEWYMGGYWVGFARSTGETETFSPGFNAWDYIVHEWCCHGRMPNYFADVDYGLHFGILGTNTHYPEYESEIFSGSRDVWVENLKNAYPRIGKMMIPSTGFAFV